MAPHKPRPHVRSVVERFEEKYIPEPMTGCWLWLGAVSGGYGSILVGSRRDGSRRHLRATRVSLELAGRPVPHGLHALHHCDNTYCVNPDHLYAGTPSQNMKDAWDRHRKVPHEQRGEKNASAKLTETKVAAIRNAFGRGRDIAAEFGVSPSTVSLIRNGRRWAHLGEAQ